LAVDDDEMMVLALEQAREAAAAGEVPVGAVVVLDGVVIARRRNEREGRNDPTAHAEVLALRDAAEHVGNWRLENATLAVTLEPCPMCAGALFNARIERVVFGAEDPKAGSCGSLYNIGVDQRLSHEFAVTAGVRAAECGALLSDFFASVR
jgi:tRNA(adenine34) deaminase